jgi:cytochrome c2
MSCPSGKIQYKNAVAAHKANEHFRKGGDRKAYKCRECHQWHLTSGPNKSKPRLRRRYVEGDL